MFRNSGGGVFSVEKRRLIIHIACKQHVLDPKGLGTSDTILAERYGYSYPEVLRKKKKRVSVPE